MHACKVKDAFYENHVNSTSFWSIPTTKLTGCNRNVPVEQNKKNKKQKKNTHANKQTDTITTRKKKKTENNTDNNINKNKQTKKKIKKKDKTNIAYQLTKRKPLSKLVLYYTHILLKTNKQTNKHTYKHTNKKSPHPKVLYPHQHSPTHISTTNTTTTITIIFTSYDFFFHCMNYSKWRTK